MKEKNQFFITFLLTIVLLSNSFAQDNTQVGLPEGAIARLGKGGINIMRFSPDGTLLLLERMSVYGYTTCLMVKRPHCFRDILDK